MRKIKFRAWDKELEQMVYDVQATYDGLEYSKVNKDIDVDVYDWMDCFESWFNDRRFDLMQYTGLKDKNGVEIYEGGVVMAEHPHLYASYLGLVSITPGDGLYIEYTDGHVDFGLDEIQYKKYIGVIGNIYENPDILEGLR